MQFDVSYFCFDGNSGKKNQDRVLVNKDLLTEGINHLQNLDNLFCFVADGIGSLANSENAAQFVLEQLKYLPLKAEQNWQEIIDNFLQEINYQLVLWNRQQGDFFDSATTLCGLIYQEGKFLTVNAGDSEIWLYREKYLQRLNKLNVLWEDIPNSPITNYFGTDYPNLKLDFSSAVSSLNPGDKIVVTTDGLLKAISKKELIQILEEDSPLYMKIDSLYHKLCAKYNPDNLGAIFISEKSNG